RSDPNTARGPEGEKVKRGFPYPSDVTITPWTVFVDTVTGTVNQQLSHGVDGKPIGKLAELNRSEYQEQLKAFRMVRNVLDDTATRFRMDSLLNLDKLRTEGPAHL